MAADLGRLGGELGVPVADQEAEPAVCADTHWWPAIYRRIVSIFK
jgi:hypothetical protein